LQGDYKVYYLPSNKLKVEAKYLQGNLHGKYREYFESGKIHIDGQYMSGKEDGQWRIYDEDGLLDSDIEYSQGEIVKVDGAQMPKK
jgi:antitoxin component YwqK of YwqJK toxin-antitoxin module